MVVLAIWLFLLGYTVAITGKRNLGLSFQAQADGSIMAVDSKGGEARTYSLMDVITCAEPSGTLQGQPPPLGAAGNSRPSTPTPAPALAPVPQLAPSFNQLPNPIPALGRIPVPRLPVPQPLPGRGIFQGLVDWETGVAVDVYNGINSLAGGLRGLFGKLPAIHPPTPRPLL